MNDVSLVFRTVRQATDLAIAPKNLRNGTFLHRARGHSTLHETCETITRRGTKGFCAHGESGDNREQMARRIPMPVFGKMMSSWSLVVAMRCSKSFFNGDSFA
jgi:hypothetical protein